MDPASMAELRDVLSKSNTRMERQEDQMMATGRAVQALVTQVSELTTQFQQLKTETASLQHPPVPNPPASVDQIVHSTEPRLPPPAFYSGEPQLCRSFLAKCSLYISLQPSSFPTEDSKVAFIITLLSGRAASWGTTVWEQKLPCCASFRSFSEELKKVFDHAASGREAARLLAELRQGDCTVTDYSYWVSHAGCGMRLEFWGAMGHVFVWALWVYQGRDLFVGFTHWCGQAHRPGYSGGFQVTAAGPADT